MMAYEVKPNTGSLFKNDKKEADSHPDYKGSALIDGVDHWLDAWINTSSSGTKYMSLKFKPKEPRGGYSGSYTGDPRTNNSSGISQPPPPSLDDDFVPF